MRSTVEAIRSPAFQLHGVGSPLLHEAGSVAQCNLLTDLVGHEGKIGNHVSPLGSPDYGLGMVHHIIKGYGDGGVVA